ncbi:serine/threonine-protein kinase RsbT [Deinococcus metalli]|uniref:Anti-sigma regulatory factor n=1 Tax=Deinococcus metalli TaxID=1141878 RepID=A0A7W8KED2_9DEIO|nr:ATP-binding protein [Deinococcus metalli]MBB5376395.1 serine/threonine-protein kinase RsbT [Deinococcus metalli]GHF44386.1 anti-sigma regulatory factor [Deinococcus metalli]
MTSSVVTGETLAVRMEDDVVRVRQVTRRRAEELGFRLVDQTKIVTAASELARNTLVHGGGGHVHLSVVQAARPGLKLVFEDHGPGIPDVPRALQDGFTTGNGLGLGLSGSRRLMDEFSIDTQPGAYTRITVVKWL